MVAQRTGDLLHRFEFASHGSCTPLVEKPLSPGRTHVLPEPLEIFSQQVGSNGLQIVLKQFGEFQRLLQRQILSAFQQTCTF